MLEVFVTSGQYLLLGHFCTSHRKHHLVLHKISACEVNLGADHHLLLLPVGDSLEGDSHIGDFDKILRSRSLSLLSEDAVDTYTLITADFIRALAIVFIVVFLGHVLLLEGQLDVLSEEVKLLETVARGSALLVAIISRCFLRMRRRKWAKRPTEFKLRAKQFIMKIGSSARD